MLLVSAAMSKSLGRAAFAWSFSHRSEVWRSKTCCPQLLLVSETNPWMGYNDTEHLSCSNYPTLHPVWALRILMILHNSTKAIFCSPSKVLCLNSRSSAAQTWTALSGTLHRASQLSVTICSLLFVLILMRRILLLKRRKTGYQLTDAIPTFSEYQNTGK